MLIHFVTLFIINYVYRMPVNYVPIWGSSVKKQRVLEKI